MPIAETVRPAGLFAQAGALFRSERLGAKLARGSLAALIANMAALSAVFLGQVVLARVLGADAFGVYVLAFTCVNFLALPARLGFETGVVRLVAQYRAQHEWPLLAGLLRRAVQLCAGTGLLLSMALVAGVFVLQSRLSTTAQTTLLIAALVVPLQALLLLDSGILRGLKLAAWTKLPTGIQAIGQLALVATVVTFFAESITPPFAMGLMCIATLAAVGVSRVRIRNGLPRELANASPRYDTSAWLRLCLPMMYMAGMKLIFTRTDLLLLGWISGPGEAGIYSAAVRVIALLALPMDSITAIAAPLISELYFSHKHAKLQRMVSLAAMATTGVLIPMVTLLLVFSDFALGMFGSEFTAARGALFILAVGTMINGLAGPVGLLLMMTGHHTTTARIWTAGAVLNLVLNVLLIPRYGIQGAAITNIATMTFWNVWMLWEVRRRLGIHCGAWGIFAGRRSRS